MSELCAGLLRDDVDCPAISYPAIRKTGANSISLHSGRLSDTLGRRYAMQHYYVEKKETANGAHEIHVPRCAYLPEVNDRIYLGAFSSCADALHQAKAHYAKATGCRWCCAECHAG